MKALFGKSLIATDPAKTDVIIAVDVSNQAFRCAFGYQNLTANGQPSGHVFGTATALFTILGDFAQKVSKSAQLAFFIDHKSKRKYELFAEYKAGRTSRESLGFDPVAQVISMCSLFPGTRYWAEDEEADDVLASFVANRTKYGYKPTTRVVVLSSDKDLWQLKEDSVTFVGNKGAIPGKEEFLESYGEHAYQRPALIPLIKAIFGDSSDNIPKIPRIPWKQIDPIFGLCTDPTPEMFYSLVTDDNTTVNGLQLGDFLSRGTYDKLIEHRSMVERNFKLTKLSKNLEISSSQNTTSKELLGSFLSSFDCRSLIPRIPSLFS